jgi:hypothetical protein
MTAPPLGVRPLPPAARLAERPPIYGIIFPSGMMSEEPEKSNKHASWHSVVFESLSSC